MFPNRVVFFDLQCLLSVSLLAQTFVMSNGRVPIMVGSEKCRLAHNTAEELVAKGEEPNEVGGYFICNGNEKIIRLLIAPRRNYPLAVQRGYDKWGGGVVCVCVCVCWLRCVGMSVWLGCGRDFILRPRPFLTGGLV